MSEEVREPQTPSEPRVVVTVGQASAALTEAGQAAAGTSPGAYEVMRVLDEAEQATTVTLFMHANGATCACGQTSCAGTG